MGANANASSKGCLPAFINDKLRSLCNDYQEWRHPADPKEGVGRELARLALTLAVLAVFLLIALGLFYRQPEVYSTRIPKARFYKDGKDYFEFFPAAGAGKPQVKGLRKLERDKVTALDCPCRRQSVTWSKFTQFYAHQFTLEAIGSSTQNTTFFQDTVAFCYFFSTLYYATTQEVSKNTSSEAKELRKPNAGEFVTFYNSCYTRLKYVIGPDPDAEPTTDNCEEADKQSPQENYYDDSRLFNGTIVGLGMQVNWTKYYDACDPPWCDVNKVNSKRTKAYTVLVQLGGLLSIATFGLQSLLWPALSTLCFTSAPRPTDLSAPADHSRSAHLSFTFVPRILAWRRRATGWRAVGEDVEMHA